MMGKHHLKPTSSFSDPSAKYHQHADDDEDMDPMHQAHENTVNTSVTSPYSSRMQRSVTNLMRTMSIRPEANDAVAAAAALSQAPP